MNQVTKSIQGVIDISWPMVLISVVVIVVLRIMYLLKNNEHLVLYRELLLLSFIIYILCLFQVVTFQYDVTWSTNNFIPFQEMFRYNIGSRLFLKNVLGNILLFIPFGFFTSYILKLDKKMFVIILTLITSLTIEIIQASIGRVFDVDDILLNLIGGYFGYLCYSIANQFLSKLPEFMKSELFFNIVSILILLGIIVLI